MRWQDKTLELLKKEVDDDSLEICCSHYNGFYVESDEKDINYTIYESKELAKKSAIESLTELLEDIFDEKQLSKSIDISKCYKSNSINIIAEDIVFSNPELDVYDIIKKLNNNLLDTINEYSDPYIWINDQMKNKYLYIQIDFKKCAEMLIDKYGYVQELDSYYGHLEIELDNGSVAYPAG